MNKITTVLISFLVGAGIMFLSLNQFKKTNSALTEVEQESEDLEKKIEEINSAENIDLEKKFGDLEETFGNCDVQAENSFLSRKLVCNRAEKKSLKHWNNFHEAERAVKNFLMTSNFSELMAYTSCEAYDITWYELHCESDRIPINKKSYQFLIHNLNKNIFSKSNWKRNKLDKRKIKNPRWLMRSRLVSSKFSLGDPWSVENHPTENGTIIILEKKIDGKIYIVGVPVTGITASGEKQ